MHGTFQTLECLCFGMQLGEYLRNNVWDVSSATVFGIPLFSNWDPFWNAPISECLVIQRGVPKFGMPLFWNACFGTPHLENPLEISFGTFGVYIFWNAPNLERLGTRFGTPLFWSSPLVI